MQNQPATDQPKVEGAKKYFFRSLAFEMHDDCKNCDQLLQVERFQLGFDYEAKFRAAIASVTVDEVQAVARKYLDPKRMAIVAAGPVTPDGKPIVSGK